jgi:DNA-binding winged helix-turn-helix (wHTH) protein
MSESARIYAFGEFQIVLERRELLRNEAPVDLKPKCFDTLAYLVENSGWVLEKDELLRALWPDSRILAEIVSSSVRFAFKRCLLALIEALRSPQ